MIVEDVILLLECLDDSMVLLKEADEVYLSIWTDK